MLTFDVDPGAPGLRQGVLLKLGVLSVGGNARQADEVALGARLATKRSGRTSRGP